jgi:hypothetical protein
MTPKEGQMEPETEHARATRALHAEADELIRQARVRLVPAVEELRRLAEADPRVYTPQDRLYVKLALLTVVALVRADRLTDAVPDPEACRHDRPPA